MAFDTNTLTLKGAELLAAATAQDRLILDGCDATTTYLDQATAVNVSSRPVAPFSNTTTVGVIGATENHVMARVQFKAVDNTGGDVNTLMLYGHSESSPNDVYVIYVASAQTAFHLPEQGDVVTIYEALMDMIYASVSGSVTTASTSVFATLAEFNLLKDRAVTTHKEGVSNQGDNQTIYGQKTFKDDVTLNGVGLLDDVTIHTKILKYTDPDNPHNVDIGSIGSPFSNLYVNDIDCDSVSADTSVSAPTIAAGDLTANSATLQSVEVASGGIVTDGNIVAEEDTVQLGTFAQPFGYCYAGGMMMYRGATNYSYIGIAASEGNEASQCVTFKNVTPYSVQVKNSNSSINLYTDGTANGCSCDVTFAGTKRVEIKYNSTSTKYETTVSTPLKASDGLTVTGTVECTSLKGISPSYSSPNTSIPIGGIILGWVPSGFTGISGKAGEILDDHQGSYYLGIATISGGTISNSTRTVPAGKYAALNDFSVGSAVLLQRVE